MDSKAFYNLTYGLFLLTAQSDDGDNGCIVNTVAQVANNPARICVAVIQGNLTHDLIMNSKEFNVSAISEDADFALFKRFGMQSGRTVNKFDGFDMVARSGNGLLYLTKYANMYLSAKVVNMIDLGSHTLFIAEVTDGEVLSKVPSCTYSYYQSNIKPKPAAKKTTVWRCKVCGYIYEGETIPADFDCPLCHHGAEDFEKVEPEVQTKKYVCPVCGYVYEGDKVPDDFICPTCHIPGSKFVLMNDNKLSAEHKFGIYNSATAEKGDISEADFSYMSEQLRANFAGECSEVGMYLCMSRIAEREGFPQVGQYWKNAAMEEAVHASKFAELLGSDLEPNMKESTKENLQWRVECELGATAGKTELAMIAKKYSLDAIHDTVHEMAKDEARHALALQGLYEKYFK